MSKPDVVNILLQTVEWYDLFLVMEIRDASQTAMYDFLDQLNNRTGNPYSLILSDRLGRTSYKEQYAFFYKESSGLSVSDAYLYDDGDESSGNDTFAREPYVIRFNSSQTVIQDFVLIPCHTAPDDAVLETDLLFDVYQDAVARWGIDDVMVLGDLNTDCRYVTSDEWDQIRLWTDPRFTWLIGSDADTTVSSTDCAYDRFVVAGDDFVNGIKASSVSVFNYKDAFNITQDLAYDVSDHWPIELDLYEIGVPLPTAAGTTSTQSPDLSTTPLPTTERTTSTQSPDLPTTPLTTAEGTTSTQSPDLPTTPLSTTDGTTHAQGKTVSSTEMPTTENLPTTTLASTGGSAGVCTQDYIAAWLSTELWSGILVGSAVVSFLMGMFFSKAVTLCKKSAGRVRSHAV
ncbi:DNASE1 [Branchiostoma lanceolatum]|uniref:DNASE1 protein n=1 Tax=Branchiostoma lanceolatum TaxID=7740 RepID=A0A8K0AEH6_BRALA|nr:DNASE1 [Branchiostoma lanceolatum]